MIGNVGCIERKSAAVVEHENCIISYATVVGCFGPAVAKSNHDLMAGER